MTDLTSSADTCGHSIGRGCRGSFVLNSSRILTSKLMGTVSHKPAMDGVLTYDTIGHCILGPRWGIANLEHLLPEAESDWELSSQHVYRLGWRGSDL